MRTIPAPLREASVDLSMKEKDVTSARLEHGTTDQSQARKILNFTGPRMKKPWTAVTVSEAAPRL